MIYVALFCFFVESIDSFVLCRSSCTRTGVMRDVLHLDHISQGQFVGANYKIFSIFCEFITKLSAI